MNIGDKLYKYVALKGIFTYEVIEVRQSADNLMVVAKCIHCIGHPPCEVLLIKSDNFWKYVDTLNDDEEEQSFWHRDCDGYYYTTKLDSIKDRMNTIIEENEESIKKYNQIIKDCEKSIIDCQNYLEVLKEANND